MRERRIHFPASWGIVLTLLVSSFCWPLAPSLKSGFEALAIHDYFKARKVFLKSVKQHPVPSNFGLSVITSRDNNPFYDLDSSYTYIDRALTHLATLKPKRAARYLRFDVDSARIAEQRRNVQSAGWKRAQTQHSIDGYQRFIENFGDSKWTNLAKDAQSALAFSEARALDTPDAYRDFLSKYPAARERYEANNRLDKALFDIYAKEGTIDSYSRFINDHPQSLHISEAQDAIYRLAVPEPDPTRLRGFIADYDGNRNVDDAWRKLYALETRGKTVDAIAEFLEKNPEYPFASELSTDYVAMQRHLYPFDDNGKWGYLDEEGTIRIPPVYEWAEPFAGTLAMVGRSGYAGVIDKTGEIAIPCEFDEIIVYRNGSAAVVKDGQFGLADLTGHLIIPMEYQDIGEPSDGIMFAQKDGMFGYIDMDGREQIPFSFDDARSFQSGRAVVTLNDSVGVIGPDGNVIIPYQYEYISEFDHGIARMRRNSMVGLVSVMGEELVPAMYDYIGEFHDGLGLAIKGDTAMYIDTLGNVAIKGPYDVRAGVKTWGDFRSGFARVWKGGKVGLIDPMGELILNTKFKSIGQWYHGLIPVQERTTWTYMDIASGKKISKATYTTASSFSSGFAIGRKADSVMFVIDTTGVEWPIKGALDVNWTDDSGVYCVQAESGSGLRSFPDVELLASIYSHIEMEQAPLVRVEKNEKWAYYSMKLNKFIWKQAGFDE